MPKRKKQEYDSYEARALYGPQSKIFDAFVFNDRSLPITASTMNTNTTLLGGFRNVFKQATATRNRSPTTKKKSMISFIFFTSAGQHLPQRSSCFTNKNRMGLPKEK